MHGPPLSPSLSLFLGAESASASVAATELTDRVRARADSFGLPRSPRRPQKAGRLGLRSSVTRAAASWLVPIFYAMARKECCSVYPAQGTQRIETRQTPSAALRRAGMNILTLEAHTDTHTAASSDARSRAPRPARSQEEERTWAASASSRAGVAASASAAGGAPLAPQDSPRGGVMHAPARLRRARASALRCAPVLQCVCVCASCASVFPGSSIIRGLAPDGTIQFAIVPLGARPRLVEGTRTPLQRTLSCASTLDADGDTFCGELPAQIAIMARSATCCASPAA